MATFTTCMAHNGMHFGVTSAPWRDRVWSTDERYDLDGYTATIELVDNLRLVCVLFSDDTLAQTIGLFANYIDALDAGANALASRAIRVEPVEPVPTGDAQHDFENSLALHFGRSEI